MLFLGQHPFRISDIFIIPEPFGVTLVDSCYFIDRTYSTTIYQTSKATFMNLQTRSTTVLQVSALKPPAQLKCVRVSKVFLGFIFTIII